MIFKQYYLTSLSHASYLIGDEESQLAAIVDPQRDVDQYLEDLQKHQLQLRYVFLTHFHADFVAGHTELHHYTGAEICLGAHAHANYPFLPMTHGTEVELGAIRLKVLETPGHTPESISIIIYDGTLTTEKPYAVLTGDTLFVGDVGRPDLMASVGIDPRTLGGQLYESLHTSLLQLPHETLVYPAHGAGSFCGKKLGYKTWSTIGDEVYQNYALQPMTKDAFIEVVNMDQPEAPDYFGYDAFLNRRDRPTLEDTMNQALRPMNLEEVLHSKSAGAQIVDVRSPKVFAEGHLCGSVNIGLEGKFETWAGMIVNRETPIIIVAEPGQEKEALIRLGRIGYDHVAGYLKKGVQALAATPELVRKTERITATQLSEQIMTANRPHILDVRSTREWQQRHVDDSRNIPLPKLRGRLQEIPTDRAVVVYCASGYRSSIAASVLEHHGLTNVMDLIGGFDAWERDVVNPSLQPDDSLLRTGGR